MSDRAGEPGTAPTGASPDDPTPLAVLRRLVAESAPLAPIHAAVHARLTDVERGRCDARMPTVIGDGLLESLLVLADFVLGVSYSSTLRAGDRIVTVRLGVQLLGRPLSGEELRATGTLDDSRAGVGLSSATITDREGRVVARCEGRNAALTDGLAGQYASTPPTFANRPSGWRLLMPHRGEDPTRDGTTMVAHPDPWTANAAGVVQGGALAGLAARGLSHALDVLPDDFSITFVRPFRPGDGAVRCRVVVEHTGRRLRVGRAELVDDRGRLLATASGTAFRH
ncbi:acyl-CoA thioesterase domain-containing protein [Actinomycetospora sp. OC33-EN08]|uniref:Acyl-CoA thioesterase domain-containing protein n=1 Tax=Actinomycetospora aurantiaca TaxID=3129233 RepID=A0ABU8MWY1_9PSEU